MDNKIEFFVSESIPSADEFIVRGICNLGTIALNSVFTGLVRDQENCASESKCIELRVTKIIAYRHDLDKLPRGVSAELHCVGAATIALLANDLLTG